MTPTLSSRDEAREVACEALDEVNAVIGAVVSTDAAPPEVEPDLIGVQHELLVLADALMSGAAPPSPDRLREVLERYPGDVPREAALLGGPSAAAGLLKLARTVGRRAARAVAAVPDAAAEYRAYLDLLAEALLRLALRCEQLEDDQVPLGMCFQTAAVVRPGSGRIDRS